MINVIDTTRRSTTYEYRIEKYFDRGFAIVLPFFDISKLRTAYLKYYLKEMAIMPHLAIRYTSVDGNVIIAERLLYGSDLLGFDRPKELKTEDCHTDFQVDRSDYGLMDSIGSETLIRVNVRNLLCAPEKMYHFMGFNSRISPAEKVVEKHRNAHEIEDDAKVNQFFVSKPTLSLKELQSFYEKLSHSLLEDGGTVDVKKISLFIKKLSVPQTLVHIFADKETNEQVKLSKARENLDQLIAEEKSEAVKKWRKLMLKDFSINWITENPGKQHTSSFNPIIEEPKDWYGDYYKPLL